MRGSVDGTLDEARGVASFVRRWQDLLERAPFPAVVVALPGAEVLFANSAARHAYGGALTLEAVVPGADQRRVLREACLADGIWEGEVGPLFDHAARRILAVPVHGAGEKADGIYLEAAWGPVAAAASTVLTRLRAADRELCQLRLAARYAEVRTHVALAASTGATLAELAALALARLERVMPVREARITLLEDDTLRVFAGRRPSELVGSDARVLLAATPAGLARAHRAPEQCVVSTSVSLYPALRPLEALGVRSVLYVPLVASGAVFGFIELFGHAREVFLADEVALATDVAHIVATALVRERVMEQAARHAQAMERRAALGQEELDRTQEQLIQAAKLSSIGELAAGLVHELNQPLNVLGGYVELLREGSLAPTAQERALDVMTRAVERMTSMVDNLRTFARAGGPAVDVVDIADVVGMARELTVGALARGVATDCPRGFVVLGDANRLEQVFVNLFANALQCEGDPVSVAVVALDDDHVAVDVRDRGPGVPDAIRARVFEPFFTTKPAGQGTGLGLSVSARIIHEHGGRVEVQDNPGGGAIFRVILPRYRGVSE